MIKVALDALGGDYAPDVVIDGANNTIKTYKNGICMYTTSE